VLVEVLANKVGEMWRHVLQIRVKTYFGIRFQERVQLRNRIFILIRASEIVNQAPDLTIQSLLLRSHRLIVRLTFTCGLLRRLRRVLQACDDNIDPPLDVAVGQVVALDH